MPNNPINVPDKVSDLELGRHLARLRDGAKLKQAELVRRMNDVGTLTWSAPVLSRIESGDRRPTPDELEQIIEAIGTPVARQLRDTVQRIWEVLPQPSLDQPDQDALWPAECVARQLSKLKTSADARQTPRINAYVDELRSAAGELLKREHQIAFVGTIGVGKSTAICRLTGLEVDVPGSRQPLPVFATGRGRTTICEVHLRSGPGYGLLIEARGDDEIRADVAAFAGQFFPSPAGEDSEARQGISIEVERAIRSLADLTQESKKGADGKQISRDPADELAKNHSTLDEFVFEVLARMRLDRRGRRDIWYEASAGKQPLEWLKDIFQRVNTGRHPEFTLPKRIETVVPITLLQDEARSVQLAEELSIRLIDTKGIDTTAARADIEGLLDDPHTLTILCSRFDDAPATEAQSLLKRAKDAGVRDLNEKVALLVLPRYDEADEMNGYDGQRVDDVAEGYHQKEKQVLNSLRPQGMDGLKVGFFNSQKEDAAVLRNFLVERVESARKAFCTRLGQVVENAGKFLRDYEQEQVQVAMQRASSQMTVWISGNRAVKRPNTRFQDSLIEEMERAHWNTVHASVWRDGDWYNLDYRHHFGYGARRMAAASLGPTVKLFSGLCENMANTPDLMPAAEFITQADRALESAYEKLLPKVQLKGQEAFRDRMKIDKAYWEKCQRESGSGYRDRVVGHSREWFVPEDRQALERDLLDLIQREWDVALTRVEVLLGGTRETGL